MAQPPEDDSFFSRWSKRKRISTVAPEQPEPEPSAPDAAPASIESLSEEDLAALPAIDKFTFETDIRPFLQKGVPLALRNSALRKKWMVTPSIRDHVDPAVDYAWDWNTPGGVPGDGIGPSAKKAAEMLRDLTQPRRDSESDIAPKKVVESTPQPSSSPADIAAQDTPLKEAQGAATEPQNEKLQRASETDIRQLNQIDVADTPVRRRHGTALPE